MDSPARIHIPFRSAVSMLWTYFRRRLEEQVQAVAFIILYLLGFQVLVLGTAPANAAQTALGVGFFVLGLTFFLEGLLLGLMPLGERVGLQLPRRAGLALILGFGLLLGLGSTLAEPAIASLRSAGLTVTPWEAPMLFRLLEREPDRLVQAIGAGVGLAVSFGMLRFSLGFSLKWFIYALVPLLLGLSILAALDPQVSTLLGLAWDAGAVTTGAVTVPLVLALGIGVSRSVGKQEGPAAGFGVVMLASAFPVLTVLLLGFALRTDTPVATTETEFFSPGHRETALALVGDEDALQRIARERGSGELRMSLGLEEDDGPAFFSGGGPGPERPAATPDHPVLRTLRTESGLALRAVIPLTALLLVVLLLLIRDKPRHPDETALGVALALLGMTLLTSGIRLGLAPLGDEVGRPLPRVFRSEVVEEGRMVFPMEAGQLLTAIDAQGRPFRFFYLQTGSGAPEAVRFDPERWDEAAGRYEHILTRPPMFGPELTLVGIGLVFLFAFGLGFGSTLAEPALSALGRTVEDITVGAIKRSGVVRSVSIGVGIGLMVGVARIMYDLPLIWLLVPPYVLLLPLTWLSDEDFAAIAWDCGGVTTGSVTVPLVLAMGLGIGGELGVVDGFGVLAMASAFPIVTVMMYGLWVRRSRAQGLNALEGEADDA